ncbi:phasin family protein [Palleronia caenipelagi]|uniref:Phasin domain-containing protein n=1 Tax=Palleronia caenipelagi TaxID=2489174 RepID=A0A547PM91_9RHOB|nr:hypothetical protein [Palleronia caenipelagi]TRD15236.1 hypothetical protein FEV53_17370 [Palleronia caenipelagi]
MAATAKKVETKVENAAEKVENKVEKLADRASANLNAATNEARTFASLYTTALRSFAEGVIEVDKLILSKLSNTASETVQQGQQILKARDVKTAIAMTAISTQSALDRNVSDTKEVLDLANARLQESLEPFKTYA